VSTSFNLSRATIDQAEALVALMERAYRGDASRKGWTSEADLIDGPRTNVAEMSKAIADPKSYLVSACDASGRLIGCAGITQESAPSCTFGKFAVEPTLQGSGLGKALLEEAERIAATLFGASMMTMTVIDGRRELEAFYERRGYARTGKAVLMANIHHAPGMTKGADLILNEFAKAI
jgi:predicted GNAT family N-acyltransferase